MYWGTFLLSMIGLYVSVKLYSFFRHQHRLKFLGLTIAGILFTLTQFSIVIKGVLELPDWTLYSGYIVEWGHIFCLSFILSSLAVFIRDSKPVFAQFPLVYSALPLLIVVSYVLVLDTYAIKSWLISIYQGGAIFVGILMYAIHAYRNNLYMTILGGTGLFFIAFILFWYVPGVREGYAWLWKIFLGGGMLVTIYGFQRIYDHNHTVLQSDPV